MLGRFAGGIPKPVKERFNMTGAKTHPPLPHISCVQACCLQMIGQNVRMMAGTEDDFTQQVCCESSPITPSLSLVTRLPPIGAGVQSLMKKRTAAQYASTGQKPATLLRIKMPRLRRTARILAKREIMTCLTCRCCLHSQFPREVMLSIAHVLRQPDPAPCWEIGYGASGCSK